MAVTEQTRHRLYVRLVEVLGSEEASTFMELVPPVGWADVATKRDLDHLAVMTKNDMDAFASTTKQDFAALRQEIATLAATTSAGLHTEIAGLESRMNIGFRSIERELRLQLYWLVGTMLTLSAITVTVSQL